MLVLKVDVVMVEEWLYEGNVKFVVIFGIEGELGILFGYECLLMCMCLGSFCVIQENGEEVILFVVGGFVDVQFEQVIVLVDIVVCVYDLDEVKVQQVCKVVEELMQNSKSKFDYVCVQVELVEVVV